MCYASQTSHCTSAALSYPPSSVNVSLSSPGTDGEVGGGAERLPLPFLAEVGGEGRQVLGMVPVSMPLGKVL